MPRRLKWLEARVTCPDGHEVTIDVHPLERMRYLRSDPTAPTFRVPCTARGCGYYVSLTAGAFQRAA